MCAHILPEFDVQEREKEKLKLFFFLQPNFNRIVPRDHRKERKGNRG
jgi:hypothetical protein